MKIFVYFVFIFFFVFNCSYINAQPKGQTTGYKLPRYVSLKSNESNLRVGASKDYPILLTYIIENFPVEIINEYKQWRNIQDINSNQGWIHENLLQGDRYGIIKTNHSEPAQILNKPEGAIIWKIGNRNIVKLNKCLTSWCHINLNGAKGWINKINIWGMYKDEEFNIPFFQFVINIYWKLI